jgi:glycerol-3-phosphate dehydrogenase
MPTDYDVVIIGAGIQGAGIAQAAAACGYRTLLLEKQAQAGMGTSCKSSKLIHGGLRYLESAQFALVRESLQERKRLLRNAPQLVKLIPFYIPVYKNSTRPAWLICLGLCIYSLFSLKPFHIIKRRDWGSLDGLQTQHLRQVFQYYDAQTDDQRLTQSVVESAIKLGARVEYQAELVDSNYTGHHQLHYRKQDRDCSISTHYLINCSGPWAAQTQKNIKPLMPLPQLELVAGSHIIIRRPLEQGAYYLQASDQRAIFAIPWKHNMTLIGTTERYYTGEIEQLQPEETEIDYLLENYNRHFKPAASRSDIVERFVGLRVLQNAANSAFNASRDTIIITSNQHPGQITVAGGKLTTYRATAEQVVSSIKLPARSRCKGKQSRHERLYPPGAGEDR